MAEPWEIKADDSRTSDTLTTYIIFCEDGTDEPSYFREFENHSKTLKVNAIANQRSGRLNLDSTLEYCNKKGMMIFENGYKLKDEVTEHIWCVYDRDLENTNMKLIEEIDDISFSSAIQTAIQSGLKVAWSNDSFELWILLHFETVPVGERLHREYVYNRLTDIFKQITPCSPELERLTSHPMFSYKINMKRRQNFLSHVRPLLRPKVEQAIKNAIFLEQQYRVDIPFHDRNPCTMVHHLVRELLTVSS